MFCEAETKAGRVAGLDLGPVRVFRGVPYGAPTGGPNRYMPPQPPRPWSGVLDCFGFGPASPQAPIDPRYTFANLLQFNLSAAVGGMSEDCLNLDLWTPGASDGGKRPVLVSLHGGGFNNGSGSLPLYDGAQLAVRGDMVVVSVTHRLNVLGHLDLSGWNVSDQFASSALNGLLDLVAALNWVGENIESFGGDPSNVTLIGQSGGGWKISCLLAMPAARGLFARAVIQSGSLLQVKSRDEGATLTAAYLAELGVTKGDSAKLQSLPWPVLLSAGAKIGLHQFEPVLDGDVLPLQPLEAFRADQAADVPLIIGSTLDDGAFLCADPTLTEDGLQPQLEQRFPGKGLELHDLYRRRRPGKSPQLLLGEIVTDAGFRRFAHAQAEQAAARAKAPVYAYQWNWPTPAFAGAFGAAHAVDVPASFGNVHDPLLGAGHPEGARLSEKLSGALVNFARTGAPGAAAAPWPAFNGETRATMVYDRDAGVVDDPDPELRAFWSKMPRAKTVFG